jgi:hypothetical protein
VSPNYHINKSATEINIHVSLMEYHCMSTPTHYFPYAGNCQTQYDILDTPILYLHIHPSQHVSVLLKQHLSVLSAIQLRQVTSKLLLATFCAEKTKKYSSQNLVMYITNYMWYSTQFLIYIAFSNVTFHYSYIKIVEL